MQDANTPTAALVAYVTPETADEAVLMVAARAKLPVYMVPSAIVKLAELPRLASGKVCCLLNSHCLFACFCRRLLPTCSATLLQSRMLSPAGGARRSAAQRACAG